MRSDDFVGLKYNMLHLSGSHFHIKRFIANICRKNACHGDFSFNFVFLGGWEMFIDSSQWVPFDHSLSVLFNLHSVIHAFFSTTRLKAEHKSFLMVPRLICELLVRRDQKCFTECRPVVRFFLDGLHLHCIRLYLTFLFSYI